MHRVKAKTTHIAGTTPGNVAAHRLHLSGSVTGGSASFYIQLMRCVPDNLWLHKHDEKEMHGMLRLCTLHGSIVNINTHVALIYCAEIACNMICVCMTTMHTVLQ